MRKFTTSVEASLRQVGVSERQQAQAALAAQRQTEAAKLRAFQQSITQISREEQRRVAESVRAANQRLREEQRAAREVARITAETARQAAAQDRIRERAAKALADVQVREAKRAARELERSLAARSGAGAAGGNLIGSIGSIAGGIPGIGGLAGQFSSISTAATAAGGSVAAFAAPIAAASVAVGALTVGLGVLAKSIFDTAKETAEFQGKFFDLSQQVGVNVETLSVLDVMAQRTGGNIDTVSGSLAIFQKGLENAHDPTSEEAKLLKELGVTSLDTETALRQALRGLFAFGEGSKQTDAVLQLFGRSGRFVNAILKESKGNLDEAAKGMDGMLVTRDAAAAADLFNDTLGDTNRILAGVTRGLVSDTIPVFTVFFQQLNQGLTGNKDDWSTWSNVVKVEVAAALGAVQGFAQFVASRGNISLAGAIDANIRTLLEESEKLKNKLRFEEDVKAIQGLTGRVLAGRPGDRPDADKSVSQAQARANKDIQLQQQRLEEITQRHRQRLDRERELDLKSIDEWEEESIRALLDHRIQQQEIFNQEAANVRKFIKDRADQLLAEREIALKSTKLNNETLQAIQKIQDDANRRRLQSELALNQQLTAIRDAEREGELKKIRQDVEAGFITRSAAIQREIALLQQAFADRQILRDLELKQITTSADRKIQLDNEKIESERRLTDEVNRLTRERIRALVEEGSARTPSPTEGRTPETPKDGNILTPEDFEDLGPIPAPDFSPWREALRDVKADLADFGSFASTAISDGIRGIAGALAEGVVAWALYGESIGVAMRKALAASAARVAGEAFFQGGLHAAYALGSLAFGDFSGAARHGIAAAKFFAIGAVAAIGARAIAGNTFRQGAAAGGGGAGGAGSQGPQQLNPITLGRNQPQATRTIVLQIQTNDSHIVKVVGADIRNAGQLRELILNDESI